jgi:2-oxoglutarate dehydrogenase E1 component
LDKKAGNENRGFLVIFGVYSVFGTLNITPLKTLESIFGPNAALVEDLYNQYKVSPQSVPSHWHTYFLELDGNPGSVPASAATNANGHQPAPQAAPVAVEAPPAPVPQPAKPAAKTAEPVQGQAEKLKGAAQKIVVNMEASLEIPTATTLRAIPVKLMMEDRTVINRHLERRGVPKVTFTHLISWAILKALKEFPVINSYYTQIDGTGHRVNPAHINLGLAIDLPGKDGKRNLVVPNIKAAESLNFQEFLTAYGQLVDKARNGKLDLPDFEGTTISITNPGMIGTVSSVPRLMKNQGAIIATGSIEYPAEFQSMSREVLNQLGISQVMNITCTYDHRIIQGAESGNFLKRVHEMLTGSDDFYESIFADLDIPYDPVPYSKDTYGGEISGGNTLEANKKAIAVMQLINMYRTRGHVLADLNPLKHGPGHNPELDFDYYGLTVWDLDREFYCGGLGGFEKAPLREIVQLLRDTYCGFIGAEFMHLLDLEERKWLGQRMEATLNRPNLTRDQKKQVLHKLNQASAFEEFLHKKYVGNKRFSLEGAETLIPMLDYMLEHGSELGIKEMVMGMAHRGRLNVLVNTMGKSYSKVFSEFEGNIDPKSFMGSGDVKYHLGAVGTHKTQSGKELRLQMLPNPSHLEAVNPVVEGATRARQDLMGEGGSKAILPLLLHGDAAFAGQGVVAETLNMSGLRGYKTGGTIHVIINNQIGFTTLPVDSRSTTYASDIAKMILAPIFHVNGDEPEAGVHAMQLAVEYRQKFGKDVVIDLIGYRKHGHNEGDEPGFTQPGLYREINNHRTVREIYADELVRRKDFTRAEVDQMRHEFDEILERAFEEAKNLPQAQVPKSLVHRRESRQAERNDHPDTTFDAAALTEIAVKLNTVPKDFDANPKLLRILARRAEIVEQNQKKIEWGFAEALAFGTLLKEGVHIRLSGQDCERGTFSHRHSVLHGTETSQRFVPLNNIAEHQAAYDVYNSPLSEFAVLGFEFGYSTTDLQSLVIWEAQFGDFMNGAQIIIDQFLSSSEKKWNQLSNVVLLLPHGFEGQGPEHSSGRMERFLTQCAEDNMTVANLTTPSNYYHLLRRQARKSEKRPLVVFSPKSLLRHPSAVSSADELANGHFHPFIDDASADPANVTRLVLCTGKVYYDLLGKREERGLTNVAIARVEQLYPFPDADVNAAFRRYPNVKEIVWCQEEPRNMGAWNFVWPRLLNEKLAGQNVTYAGRDASAAPATGSAKLHEMEQMLLLNEALGLINE